MLNVEPWRVAQLDGLLRDRKGSRDDCLGCDDGRHRGEDHHRITRPVRGEQKERVLYGCRIGQQQRALSKIIENERRQDKPKPGVLDWLGAEVPHVRIERFCPGNAQYDGTEREESQKRIRGKKTHRVERIGGSQDRGVLDDRNRAEHGDHSEPDDHDGPEERADAGCPPPLDHEEPDQHHQGDGQDVRLERRGDDLKPFDGGKHRDGRGDHAIAIEKGGAEQPERDQQLLWP